MQSDGSRQSTCIDPAGTLRREMTPYTASPHYHAHTTRPPQLLNASTTRRHSRTTHKGIHKAGGSNLSRSRATAVDARAGCYRLAVLQRVIKG